MSKVLSSDAELRDLMLSAKTIAVVGISDRSNRPSFEVAHYLLDAGYEVIPVNPQIDGWEGLEAYPSLIDIGRPVDIVDVFRRPEFVPAVVDDAIAARAAALWTQLGVVNDEATGRAVAAGIPTVIDRCMAIEHRRLIARRGDH